ncbi:MAG TPA: BadF/BadG/BcrA/BcrD ATPase family protein, partial [Anaerolineae bacterium]|nr:BadF/BadG/BcrA/BcrD ATPase family protein [Anaerolineae bacterium]
MAVGIGIDIGSISIKAAVVGKNLEELKVKKLVKDKDFFKLSSLSETSDLSVLLSTYKRIRGRPLDAFENFSQVISDALNGSEIHLAVTGSGGKLAGITYNALIVNEFAAIVEAINKFHPDVRTVFEMGGETSKYILLGKTTDSEPLHIFDYSTNGDCAAGTGSFMDQQSSRLKFRIEDIGDIVERASKAAQIAGRCSVFAKSDMIHAQQRGYQPDEVLKGLCNAVMRNFKSAICRSKKIVPPVIFIGGVSLNTGILRALMNVFDLNENDIYVPETMCWLG